MKIHDILQLYARQPQVGALVKSLKEKPAPTVFLRGLLASATPMVFAAAAQRAGRNMLFILQDADDAGYFYNDLVNIFSEPTDEGGSQTAKPQSPKPQVLFFPSSYKRAIKYGQRDAANEILRTEVLAALSAQAEASSVKAEASSVKAEASSVKAEASSSALAITVSQSAAPCLIVTHPEALAELVVSQQHLSSRRISLRTSQQLSITALIHQLRDLGFTEEDYVYEPGQFANRGSIVDVYSFSSDLPYRIDFFGDEVDTIRTFTVEDQLSKDKKTEVEIVPELAAVTTEKVPILEFLPQDTLLVMKDLSYITGTVERIYNEGFSDQALTERLEGATEMEQQQIRQQMTKESTLCAPTQFKDDIFRFQHVFFGPETIQNSKFEIQNSSLNTQHSTLNTQHSTLNIPFHTTAQPLFHKNFDLLRQALEDYLLKGYRLYILADSKKQQQRLKDIFDEMSASDDDLPRTRLDAAYDIGLKTENRRLKTENRKLTFIPVDHTLHGGYADDDMKACFFTDHQIFDRFHKYNLKTEGARSGKMALTMKELQEMEIGDFIVHVDFGIGKFGGLVRTPTGDGGYQECIRIIYQNNDKVDVSIHSLYKVSKYRSSETGEPPRLSTLGTGAWERLKEKTKKRIKDIARDLIRLYAKRRHERGFAFSPDNFMQHELEASFMYEDTPDQLKATQEVKGDMERAVPMDRLICGDVGFGKTEVAMRAAFKAACDSKQVAVLVPTTVLAFQHYQTFRKRLDGFPVRVDYLSRARTAKQTHQVLDDLESGKIDIIVGTHKLLGKAVKWHDLGLLIIDEEQKFGVATKEKLRKLKTNVDTLTMSATPIPRTLQFSLMGARDMSIMRTPPPNRYPIHTELCTFSHEVITDAINFEMSRGGQTYFVTNRISALSHLAELIHQYVPDCRVAIGHGQMPPEELEKTIMGFINYDYDVLLSTTIVENGVDIPNANTIIIDAADHFGLSDLHQMRGRVGRSNRKAFCYLLAPPKSVMNSEARRRLEALETFSDLGSGFNLAMQDLDLRGAGNLLGSEQSGFMEDLGYETYQKILSQAVTELKNDEFSDLMAEDIKAGREVTGEDFVDDCAVESDLQMYFPETYVPGDSERMLLYRELDNIQRDEDLSAYRQRLVDRFGPVPPEGEELMQVVMLRRLGKQLGCEKIILRQGIMRLQFVSNASSPFYQSTVFGGIIHYVMDHPRRCTFKDSHGHRMVHISEVPTVKEAVAVLRGMSPSPRKP